MITKTYEIHELEAIKINSSNKDEFDNQASETIKKILSQLKRNDSHVICAFHVVEIISNP